MPAERSGGVRGLARAMAGKDGSDCEPATRRWLALAGSEPRSINQLNPIVARLAKFSRSETKKLRRRIRAEAGPVGDRQAILAHISLLNGAEKPVVPTPEETLVLPLVLVQDRCESGHPWPLFRVPDGQDRHSEDALRRHLAADRGIATAHVASTA